MRRGAGITLGREPSSIGSTPAVATTANELHASGSRRRFMAKVAAGVPALIGLSAFAREAFQSIDITGATYGRDFRLRDPDGRVRTLADFHGKAVLLFFGFTQCPDVCPTTLARAAQVMKLLGSKAERLQVIFVTIDPERDTPELLRNYTRAFDPRFIALHADLPTTAKTAQEFKVFYEKVPTGSSYTMDHTAIMYAIDQLGRLRLAIKPEETAASLAADLKLILDEPRARNTREPAI